MELFVHFYRFQDFETYLQDPLTSASIDYCLHNITFAKIFHSMSTPQLSEQELVRRQ